MTRTYECMFLIDNDVVRAGWGDAKSTVADLVRKHGGEVLTSRRWDERRLAYPIKHRRRATYLLNYCTLENERIEGLRRDLDISESVLRYLILSAEAVPETERELSAAEEVEGFQIPEPPPDDTPEPEELAAEEEQERASTRDREPAREKANPESEGAEASAPEEEPTEAKAATSGDSAEAETVKTSEEG